MCSIAKLQRDIPKLFLQPKESLGEGHLLEYLLLKQLQETSLFDDVIHEEFLRKQWGWAASGVDHLVVLGDYVIPIQTKWRKSRRRENLGVDNFLKSVEFTLNKTGKQMLFGLWVSKIQPFSDNMQRLEKKNIICVSDVNSIDCLVSKACYAITEKIKHLRIHSVCI